MQGTKWISQNFPRKTAESQPIIQVSETFPCPKGHAEYMRNTSEKHMQILWHCISPGPTYWKKKMNLTLNKPVRSRMWACPCSSGPDCKPCPGTKAQALCLHILLSIRRNWPAGTGSVLQQDLFAGTWEMIWQWTSPWQGGLLLNSECWCAISPCSEGATTCSKG